MAKTLSIGIVVTSHGMNGPAKLTAIMANDLAQAGHKVSIFIPILPYYYYFVVIAKRPISWLKNMIPYVKLWIRNRKFAFQPMLTENQEPGSISTKFVLTYASKRTLRNLDHLIVNGIGDVAMYKDRFPQTRQIYIVNQLEERAQNRPEYIEIRKTFPGRLVAISEFMARKLSEQVEKPPVIPNPISPGIWAQRDKFDINAQRQDILFYWKNNDVGRLGGEILNEFRKLRPDSSITIWFRSGIDTTREMVERIVPSANYVQDLGEKEVTDLLLSHSLMLYPQKFEEFGMPPVEGLACGCVPALHPNVGAADMYARNGENALFLEDSPEQSATKIKELLDDPIQLSSMRGTTSSYIDIFNPDRYGQRILESADFL